MSSASRGSCAFVDEDGPYQAVREATPWAASRHVWVVHIGLEGSYHSHWMDIWDITVDSAESLQILAESLSFFLLEKLQVAGSSWFLMAAREGTNEHMAQVSP